MNESFDYLENKFESLLVNQREQSERLTEVEERCSAQERRIQALELCMDEMEKCNKNVFEKVADLDGHGRRNSIKIVEIDEDEENGRPTDFIAGLIP